jgi:hypothetical protein
MEEIYNSKSTKLRSDDGNEQNLEERRLFAVDLSKNAVDVFPRNLV